MCHLHGNAAPAGVQSDGDQLKVVLVPTLYAPNGSKRAPDTAAARIEAVRAPWACTGAMLTNGTNLGFITGSRRRGY